MNPNPSLLAASAQRSDDAPRQTASLVDLLYDGFYLVFLLKNRHAPTGAEGLANRFIEFLDGFERDAKRQGTDPEAIYAAKYALCATVDEVVLGSSFAVRSEWERQPLQLALFGDVLAGERFFDKLEQLRGNAAARLEVLEVFHMCLLLGFKGRYLLEGTEKLGYLTAQLGEQIAHLKGKHRGFAPHWALPDRASHTLRREIPLWVIGALTALMALGAYVGLRSQLSAEILERLDVYQGIISESSAVPRLVITLP
ncbi:type IVB secretion system protein IcmH/DotU [Cognatazoarcus halotolerans]|uniref:type IVB secretion system protein IcmH/DotU n=1 Tax=Cognatazoarcus halotolerans TaxID=2686016 RepID=UPI001356E63E|nr:type IVB secretion system protein IcmH/DotU [Cognatazoarcus halotolerans]MBX3680518.1 type IVB secretion system protein IcmH/DotU [Rhodocyclaceae bacterium]MCP5311224.1 DotU family type IV/VI secretion system protein [Zoogloeaceae bacterium]